MKVKCADCGTPQDANELMVRKGPKGAQSLVCKGGCPNRGGSGSNSGPEFRPSDSRKRYVHATATRSGDGKLISIAIELTEELTPTQSFNVRAVEVARMALVATKEALP